MNFRYGKKEMDYLKARDRRLGVVIDQIGRISWMVAGGAIPGLTDPAGGTQK